LLSEDKQFLANILTLWRSNLAHGLHAIQYTRIVSRNLLDTKYCLSKNIGCKRFELCSFLKGTYTSVHETFIGSDLNFVILTLERVK